MALNSQDSKRVRLVWLIRRIAREEAWEAIDEHLDDYEHKEKPLEDFELEGLSRGKNKKRCNSHRMEDSDWRAHGEECQF